MSASASPAAALDSPLDRRAFRNALGHYATGVAIVTARDAAGQPVGMTINSFASVSLEPPLVLWSVQLDASGAETYRAAPHFAIHVLAADQEALARTFADTKADRFADRPFEDGIGGVPLLPGSVTRFECRLWAVHPGGDHDIIVGEVLRMQSHPAATLGFHRGQFVTLP
jgi:flavin reductase (DIM6/NTAB) family NADH-FMN oxidoreductase RutF